MRKGILLAVLVLSVTPAASALYGGREANANEGSAAVYFSVRAGRMSGECSGALFTNRAVLTAGHCVRSHFGEHRVTAVRIGNPRGRAVRARVASVHVHPRFDHEHPERGYDAAVLVLAEPVSGVTPLRIATAAEDPTEQGTPITIMGFGLTRGPRGVRRSRGLNVASLEYLSPFHCFSGDVATMATTRMCAASPQAGVCPGDSGSAATRDVSGTPVVVGIVSLAIDAQTCTDTAAVLTRVSSVHDFLTSAALSR